MPKTVTDAFAPYIGTVEYNGIVATIQKWYYGDLVKDSWCATSMSYFANTLGLLDKIGGKNENVYYMMKACENAGDGIFFYRKDIPQDYVIRRGTIIFLLTSDPPMTSTSRKHVTSAYEDFTWKGKGYVKCLGGNQSDRIKVSQYSQSNIYAIFRPNYGETPTPTPTPPTPLHKTLRRGDKGESVREMQAYLNTIGFMSVSGQEMVVDGSFGPITEKTVTLFQTATKCCTPDGICGPLTWAAIDKLLDMKPERTTAMTEVYIRSGPGADYKALGTVKEGDTVTYTSIVDGWLYLPDRDGWSRSSYYWLD